MYFFKGRWFNVISQLKKGGIYYYCNIATPFIIEDNTIVDCFQKCEDILKEKTVSERLINQLNYYRILYECYNRYVDDGRKRKFEDYLNEVLPFDNAYDNIYELCGIEGIDKIKYVFWEWLVANKKKYGLQMKKMSEMVKDPIIVNI